MITDWLSAEAWQALQLSLKVAAVATVCALPLALAVAWLLARRQFFGKTLVDSIVHLPLVLPPVVVGYLLLLGFGRRGPFGAWLEAPRGWPAETGAKAGAGTRERPMNRRTAQWCQPTQIALAVRRTLCGRP